MKHMVFICFYVFLPWPSSIEITEQLKAKLEKRDLTSTCHPQEHLRLTTRRCDYDNVTTPSTPYCKCTKWIQMDQVQRSSWYIMVPQFHNSFAQLEFTMHIDIFGTWTQWKGCQQHPSSIDLGLHWSSEKWHLGYRLSMLGILWGLIWDTMIYIYMINMEYYGIITINGD